MHRTNRRKWRTFVSASALFILLAVPLLKPAGGATPPVTDPSIVSKLLPPLITPVTQTLGVILSLLGTPRDMKLLVIAADGTEPSYAAIRAILDQIGVPYDAVVLTQTGGALPPLNNMSKGFYQGIILSTGNLATCTTNPCTIALPAAGWAALDKYAANYGVRTVSYYTFPDPRYGITWSGFAAPGGSAAFLPAAAGIFPYLNRNNPLTISNAFLYTAVATPGAGETTTPFLTMGGQIAGVTHKKADGREYLALTFDNNPYLTHSLALGYGIVNWVTKGIFLGYRKAYYSPQIDDIFLGSDLFDATRAGCKPPGFQLDPTVDPTAGCPNVRITGADLSAIAAWQNSTGGGQSGQIKVTMAFNGFGTTALGEAPPNDSLPAAATQARSQFYWITHTYDHENLDCYDPVPNSGVCTPATSAQSLAEIDNNKAFAQQLNLVTDNPSMVTPNVSGLNNPKFLSAAVSRGIRYVVSDASVLPAAVKHNTGVRNTLQPSILMIPRRPTNIFYNVDTNLSGVPASETDEYNYFYGPNGISRIGGPGGPPFFTSNQTYTEIIDRESDFIVRNILRGEVYPVMFHQANLWRYNGINSLFTDLSDAILAKFRGISTLPVNSLSQTSIGQVLEDRMAFNASGVSATLTPGLSMTIKVSKTAKIPVTGLCRGTCESYGGQSISSFTVNPLLPTLILLP